MFCSKCGKQLPEDAAFCSGCGSKTRSDSTGGNSGFVNYGGYVQPRFPYSANGYDFSGKSIATIILIVLSFIFSFGDVVRINYYVSEMSMDYAQLSKTLKNISSLAGESTASIKMIGFGNGVLVLGHLLLLAGIALIIIKKTELGKCGCVIGSIANLLSMLILFFLGCQLASDLECGLGDIFTMNVLFSVAVNIIIMVVSPGELGVSSKLELYDVNYSAKPKWISNEPWKCHQCGKINNSSVNDCICGAKRIY